MEKPQVLLDLVVLSDLMVGPGPEASALTKRLHLVDKDNLDDLLRSAAVCFPPDGFDAAAGARIKGGIPGASDLSAGAHRIEGFRDLRPERLVDFLPDTRELLRMRAVLTELAQGQSRSAGVREVLSSVKEPPELVEAIQKAMEEATRPGGTAPPHPAPTGAPGAPAAARDPGSSLFDLVDIEGSRERSGGAESQAPERAERSGAAARTGLEGLIEDLLGLDRSSEGRSPGAPSPEVIRHLIQKTDFAIAGSLRTVFMDPRFRAIESAWLSLRFLVRRLDFRTGIRLHVLSVRREDIVAALRETVLPFVDDLREEGRLACILLDFSFGDGDPDPADLAEIAAAAAGARTPVVAALDSSVLGVDSLGRIGSAPDLSGVFEAAGRQAYGALRSREESRWLALCVNRFLFRFPYGKNGEPVKGFDFEEIPGEAGAREATAAGPWGRPSWIIGVLIANSFARTGWGVEITGPGDAGAIGDLPVRPLQLQTGEVVQSALEVLLPENRVLELSRAGIITFASRRNTDRAFLTTAPTFFRPARSEDRNAYLDESRRATLPYQFFLTQVLAWTESVWCHLDPGRSAEEIARTLSAGVQFLALGPAGPVARITGEAVGGPSAASRIALRVEPSGEPLRGLPPVAIELPMPRG